jgi:hypothetical protein
MESSRRTKVQFYLILEELNTEIYEGRGSFLSRGHELRACEGQVQSGARTTPFRIVIPSAARDLHFAANCRSLAALGMTNSDELTFRTPTFQSSPADEDEGL